MRIYFNISSLISGNLLKIFILLIPIISSCKGMHEKNVEADMNTGGLIVFKAKKFRLEKTDSNTIVTVLDPWQGAESIKLVYNLVRRGSKLPDGLDSSSAIFVPLKKVICMSTTHAAMISALGEEETISGMSGTDFFFSGSLNEKVKEGKIADVGYDSGLNKELILKISPDLIMMYGIGSESAGYVGKLKELGVKVIFNADYLETDPLSKAEWIKLFGALYCKENLADSLFNSEVENYNKLKGYISKNVSVWPKVLLGLPYKDSWFISPGNSFISKIIEDAGGVYLWQNTISSVSMPYGLENVYMKALNADYWLNIGVLNAKDEISMVDQRLMRLPCFINGNMYNNNRRTTERGGNDYWEMGTVSPHLILKDIAAILHPDLFIDHELFFYRKIY